MNTPQPLSIQEWKEVMTLRVVRESWGLSDETPEQFSAMVYGVKFHFVPMTMPGYVGDLYILSGDALGEPLTLIRKDGKLTVV